VIGYLVRRLAAGAGVVVSLLVLTFLATHVIGDPVTLLVDRELGTEADRRALIAAAGFDRPVWQRFLDYAGNVVRGEFGQSLWQNRPARDVVFERIPATAQLASLTLAVTLLVAVPLAALGAAGHGRWPELLVTALTTAGAAIAPFWWALTLIMVVAVQLRWLPTSGIGTPQHLVLPVLALALQPVSRLTQVLHVGLVAENRQAYVTVARAKGLSWPLVTWRHVLRNAALPAVTVIGFEVVRLLSSTVLVETIFAWPGVGQVALQAVENRDLPVLVAAVFYVGVLVTLTNLVVDLVYPLLDARVRLT
jgi:peptide/nickel transport system permease protein